MAEYISKQDVIDYLNGYLHSLGEVGADTVLFDRGQRRALVNAMQDISAVKAADVQPVKHGRWRKDKEGYDIYVECSECGLNLSTSGYIEPEWRDVLKYCPCCSARMDVIYEDDKVKAIKVAGWDGDTE